MLAAVVISAHIQLPLFALCPRCKESKPLKAFPRNRRRPTGHHSACRICHSKTETKRYHANKPRISAARRHRRHGVSPETFDFPMRTQDERCANCGTSFSAHPNSPCVDHDAEIGKVRGLLCNRCNLRIEWRIIPLTCSLTTSSTCSGTLRQTWCENIFTPLQLLLPSCHKHERHRRCAAWYGLVALSGGRWRDIISWSNFELIAAVRCTRKLSAAAVGSLRVDGIDFYRRDRRSGAL
jgi:Recombination endonuclease VII